MSARLRSAVVALVAVLAAVSAGCSALPESGPVVRLGEDRADRPQDAPYFDPPGPAEDGSPAAIVSGFLVAMQANPLSTKVAREFLSDRAQANWKPNRGTIVYEAFTVVPTSAGANVRLADTRRLDGRGGWLDGAEGRSETLELKLVAEDGQWRIDNPVNALVVPTSFFDRAFARFNLYFYDQTGQVLLPDPVFIPRGDQTASNLVRGLLAGPGDGLAEVTRSALPSRTDLDLSVVVTESGVAEVPLSREVLRASSSELSRAVDQLAWTLRQVPDIERVRITVSGVPVPLAGGRLDVAVSSGPEYDAGGSGTGRLWGVRGGRVVDLTEKDPTVVEGALGRPGYSVRSLAVSESPRRIAAVSGNGSTVFVAGAGGPGSGAPVATPLTRATDVLRPSFDMFGDLWLIDRTARGARVYVVRDDKVRRINVPGVTGQDVSAFAVSRDGSQMAVAYTGSPAPDVRVTRILRTDEGIVSGAGGSRVFAPGDAEASRIVDIGWRGAGTLALLSRPKPETSQVRFISADGSPPPPGLAEPSDFRGAAQAMVVAPDPDLPLHLVTEDQRVYTLARNGSWPRTSSKVVAAAYAR